VQCCHSEIKSKLCAHCIGTVECGVLHASSMARLAPFSPSFLK
jgi:hypothetical protein